MIDDFFNQEKTGIFILATKLHARLDWLTTNPRGQFVSLRHADQGEVQAPLASTDDLLLQKVELLVGES